jgi:hypothetical protein
MTLLQDPRDAMQGQPVVRNTLADLNRHRLVVDGHALSIWRNIYELEVQVAQQAVRVCSHPHARPAGQEQGTLGRTEHFLA